MPIGSNLRSGVLTALIVGLMALPAAGRAQDAIGLCGDSTVPHLFVDIDGSPRLDLELARTPQEHEVGLMYRESLPADGGMLFVYQSEAREGYWMYHTLIPLSIAWIDRYGNIVDIQDMARLNDPNDVQEAQNTVYNPAKPYWYALEANQGWFVQHGVGVGQVVTFCL